MDQFRSFFLFPLCLTSFFVSAQAIDNALSFRNINGNHYWKIYYENDFFTRSDRDYTQGICIEWVNPAVRKFLLSRLLWRPPNSELKYSLAVEDDSYTPNYIDRPGIQWGDRPYAGALFLKTALTATNTCRRDRLCISLSTGLIGPAAGGEQMQRTIHHWISYTQPQGWHNQIRNDLVLNYQLNYERELLFYQRCFSFASYSSIRVGTLSTKATTGFTIMAGHFYSPFESDNSQRKKNFRWYLYDQPLINLVGYDASLQGGVFNRRNPYTIVASDINHLTFQHRFGVIVTLKKLYLEYFQTGLTEEFKTSVFHRTGGVQIGFGFN